MIGVFAADNPYRAQRVKAEHGHGCSGLPWSSAKRMKSNFSLAPMPLNSGLFQSGQAARRITLNVRRSAVARCNVPDCKLHLNLCGRRGPRFRTGRLAHFQGSTKDGVDILNFRVRSHPPFVAAAPGCLEKTMLRHLNGRKRGLKTCR